MEEMAKALECGRIKYTERNWMKNKVKMNTYRSAILRHLNAIAEGEDIDPESGAHHLGHVMAGCAIMLDARKHGMLVDDRVLPQMQGPHNTDLSDWGPLEAKQSVQTDAIRVGQRHHCTYCKKETVHQGLRCMGCDSINPFLLKHALQKIE